ncbi:MAG: hypothetical protein KBD24_04585 [Candidatus Pacebacteria bacterium]|nr:hypothetical protein [Candidatus Paceibacterota bacterium]
MTNNMITVLWVGLSEKPTKNGEQFKPLAPDTASGKVLITIEEKHPTVRFVKTNLVRMAPLDGHGKLRYPTRNECVAHYPQLAVEIASLKPSLVLLLGRQVSTFVLGQTGVDALFPALFSYEAVSRDGVCYAGIHHPSYVSVYRRKQMDQYERAITALIDGLR